MKSQHSQLNHLSGMNVFAFQNYPEHLEAWPGIQIQHGQSRSAFLVSAERHRSDVDSMIPEQSADTANHSGPIGVLQNQYDAVGARFHWSAIHAYNSRCCAKKCASYRHGVAVRDRGKLE